MSMYNGAKGAYNLTGISGVSEVYMVTTATASTGSPKGFWSQWGMPPRNQYMKMSDAYTRATGGINEVILLSPEDNLLTSTLTWAKNMTHLVGMYPAAKTNLRSRLDQSGTFTPMVSVTGYGNQFQNLYTMHGTAATDLVGWSITGYRNTFKNVHFGSPQVAAQDTTGYVGVQLTSDSCYFQDCTFGYATTSRSGAYPNLQITQNSDGFAYHKFENCDFIMFSAAASPVFINVQNTSGVIMADFVNCSFINVSTNMGNTLTSAITFSASATACLSFDNRCRFIGVGHLTAKASMPFLQLPTAFPSSADELNLISTNSASW